MSTCCKHKLPPLNERVREYMESLGFTYSTQFSVREPYWKDLSDHRMFLTENEAEFMYLASLQARKDTLTSVENCDPGESDDLNGWIRKQKAELDKLMETNQPNTTQGGE